MVFRAFSFFIAAALFLSAATKKSGSARGENEELILNVTLYIDPEDVKNLVGSDLGGHYFVAEVKVEPKFGKDVVIDRDDFQLRTDKDGEKAKPFAATQIAGQDSLIISEGEGGEAKARKSRGWSIGAGPGMMGSGSGDTGGGDRKATMQTSEKQNPLVKVLEQKILPQGKTDQPVSGLLYFPMEKQKLKDLELTYGGRENRIALRFK